MYALLFAIACLVGLIHQVGRAGWSLRRADRRVVYWCLVGLALGVVFTVKSALPILVGALAVGVVGAACLYGIVADWQGWWTG
jgi:hypothetical protein